MNDLWRDADDYVEEAGSMNGEVVEPPPDISSFQSREYVARGVATGVDPRTYSDEHVLDALVYVGNTAVRDVRGGLPTFHKLRDETLRRMRDPETASLPADKLIVDRDMLEDLVERFDRLLTHSEPWESASPHDRLTLDDVMRADRRRVELARLILRQTGKDQPHAE